jgi:hypothetical protein
MQWQDAALKAAALHLNLEQQQRQDAALPDEEVGTQKTRKLGAAWANVTDNADPSGHPLKTRIRDDK